MSTQRERVVDHLWYLAVHGIKQTAKQMVQASGCGHGNFVRQCRNSRILLSVEKTATGATVYKVDRGGIKKKIEFRHDVLQAIRRDDQRTYRIRIKKKLRRHRVTSVKPGKKWQEMSREERLAKHFEGVHEELAPRASPMPLSEKFQSTLRVLDEDAREQWISYRDIAQMAKISEAYGSDICHPLRVAKMLELDIREFGRFFYMTAPSFDLDTATDLARHNIVVQQRQPKVDSRPVIQQVEQDNILLVDARAALNDAHIYRAAWKNRAEEDTCYLRAIAHALVRFVELQENEQKSHPEI